MPARPLRPILGRLGLTQIKHVAPVRRRAASPLVARVYREVENDFGVLAPPIVLHAGAPLVLAAAWVMLRETLVVPGTLSRADKEVIAAAVSRQNACPYCVAIHESVVGRLGFPEAVAPPAGGDPETIAMTVVMHYLNRMVNVFLREVPLPPGVPGWALRPVMRVLGTDMLAAAGRSHVSGTSLDLLPDAAPTDDPGRTAGPTGPVWALARAGAVIEAAGRRALPDGTRATVLSVLSKWRGEPMSISRRWTDELVAGLPEGDRAPARLALLVAMASFQVDATVINDCRAAGADDRALLELSAWSALTAARKMGSPARGGAQ